MKLSVQSQETMGYTNIMKQIKFNKCDECGSKATGVLFHDHGAPVLFVCRGCDPRTFEAVAQADMERYMAGENL